MATPEIEKILREIAEEHEGIISAEMVVEAARPNNSPLHPYFTWRQSDAAANWRLHEARQLIRSVKVIVETREYSVRAPAYIRDPTIQGPGYATVARLRSNEEASRDAVIAEFRRAAAAMARARAVAVVLGLRDEVDDLHRRVVEMIDTIEDGPHATN